MGEQLWLFREPQGDGPQLDLFQDRTIRLGRADAALTEFDFELAEAVLADTAVRYPSATDVRDRINLVRRLRSAFLEAGGGSAGWFSMEHLVPAWLHVSWCRHTAQAMEQESGPGAMVGDRLAGVLWLLAGDLERARFSLSSTLTREPSDAIARVWLGNVLVRLGRSGEARLQYGEVLAQAPDRVPLDCIEDKEVAELHDLAQYQYEVTSDAPAWMAAVGIVERVLPMPALALPGFGPDPEQPGLPVGIQFLRWMMRERQASGNDRIAARRAMKRLCPPLFQAFLKQFR